ncbi:DUF21 domain-containing protein [Eggerthellaceae bacterium zg-893]|nr:DUF21 domain-containing protein [Eggerthellaceae bacterium zg-893]
MDIGISIFVTLLLIVANGFFSMSEMALVNVRLRLLRHEAEEGDARAQRAYDLASDCGQMLATIQVAITLVGFFASAAAATNLSAPFAAWLSSFGVSWLAVAAPMLAPILITLAVSYLSIVIGELVPKRIALANTEAVSKQVAGPLHVFKVAATPLVALTSASANGLAALLGIRPADDRQNVSEEEIKVLVTDNEELLDDEKRMIHEILDLSDMRVREIMQPRVDMILVEDVETVQHAIDRMRGTGYSRLPVYHEDIDDILGIVHYKDLMGPVMDGKGDEPVAGYLHHALFVPDLKNAYPLLAEMQTNHQQMAIAVDEYGGTAGLVTVEDIVEEIVGEIVDETDRENNLVVSLGEGRWNVDGRLPVEDAELLGWPVDSTVDYETMAGWLMDSLDAVPKVGDKFAIDGYDFKILNMRRHRVQRIRVTKRPEEDAGPADSLT